MRQPFMRMVAVALLALTVAIGALAIGPREKASATEILDFHTVLHDSSHQDLSSPIAANISVHDYAFIQVSGAPPLAPSTVTFKRYKSSDCSGYPASVEEVPLTLEGPGSAHAESSSFVTSGGDFSYLATFNGDGAYPSMTAACESFKGTNDGKTNTCNWGWDWSWSRSGSWSWWH